MGTLGGLATRMRRIADRIPTSASDAAVEVTRTILSDLAFRTPVDESTARSNWQVKLGSPIGDSDEIAPYYPGELGSTGTASAQAAIAAGETVLSGKTPGEKIYLSNVLDYIVPLDEGHSQQEPAGFVHRSVLIGRKIVAKFKVGLMK